jgi:arylsulfatase A-like enzyme
MHGTDLAEDMTIPMFFVGDEFTPGIELKNISILDIAPTIADVMGLNTPREWEGKSILEKED